MKVIQLLHDNGVNVSESKKAYEQLKQYERNPFFCMLLSCVFASPSCPVEGFVLTVNWTHYRQLAGLTLKNNLRTAAHELGEEAVLQAARSAIVSLSNPSSVSLARVSAQIVVEVTRLTSFDWWSTKGLVQDLPSFLLGDLLHAGGVTSLGALFTLQYIMEDLSQMVGESSEQILTHVALLAGNQQLDLSLRKAAFRLCFNSFEQASLLDWNISTLSSLQKGVVKASWPVASVCTSILANGAEGDVGFQLEVMRSCFLLLDYFEYFPSSEVGTPITPGAERLTNGWMTFAMMTMATPPKTAEQTELVAACIDLIAGVFDAYNQSEGESPSHFLVIPILPVLDDLFDVLVKYSVLTDEEVEEAIKEDDCQIRSSFPAISLHDTQEEKDIVEDRFLEGGAAVVTLRKSAIKCIESLCQFGSATSVPLLLTRVEKLLKQTDSWKSRELGFVLLGTIAGCVLEKETLLSGVVEHAMRVVADASDHFFVSSMALWALSRLLDKLYTFDRNLFDEVTNTIASQLVSTSKRVQCAAVTGMIQVVTVLEQYFTTGTNDSPLLLLQRFSDTFCRCLSVYHTVNLSLLVQLIVSVFPYWSIGGGGSPSQEMIIHALQKERAKRSESFEKSYESLYVKEMPNAVLDKDIFAIDRAVVSILTLLPDSSFAVASVTRWNAVLGDILQRHVADDVDLLQCTLLMCAAYIKCIRTNDFHQYLSPALPNLYSCAFEVWKTSRHLRVKLAAMKLHEVVIRTRLAAQSPGPVGEEEQALLVKEIATEDDPHDIQNTMALGLVLVEQHPTEPCSQKTYTCLNQVLRSDVYGESLPFYIEMAFACCKTASTCPQFLLPITRLDVIIQLLTQSTNDDPKADATINLVALLHHLPPEKFACLLPDLLRLLYSWQQVACQYAGAMQALLYMISLLQQHCRELLQVSLSDLPPSLLGMIREVYHL